MKPDLDVEDDFMPEIDAPKKVPRILLIILLLVTVVAIYYYNQFKTLSQDPNKVGQQKVTALVEKIGKLIELPKGETPILATISDMGPLAGNPFFANAKLGYQVLFFAAARQAYLYDPEKNVIVEVASLNIGQ